MGEKKEENERNKTPQKPGGIGLGLGRNRWRKTALGFGSVAAVRRRETDLTGGPHLSASAREGAGGSGLGRRGPRSGRERKERVGPETAQRLREGDF